MKKIFITILFLVTTYSNSFAKCDTSSGLDLVTRVCYECMLPLYIASVPVALGPMHDAGSPITSAPICACPVPPPLFVRIGIPISLYNPNTVVETVNDPLCMPSLGLDLSNLLEGGILKGTYGTKNGKAIPRTFMQSHKVVFPLMYMIGAFLDSICFMQQDMDIAYLSEFDPTWNVDILAFWLAPESILFGNPVTNLACMADSMAAASFDTLDSLFWCKGSHGMAYPMTGNVQSKTIVEDSASITENFLFHLHRIGLGTTSLLCAKAHNPIWKKSDYRLQIIKPLPHPIGFTIGQTDLMWGMGKNPPAIGDNFVYLIFKKTNCCAF